MAVLKVKAASIIGRMEQLDSVIRICGKSGFFHPDDARSFYSDTHNFVPIAEENPYASPLQKLKTAAQIGSVTLRLTDTSGLSLSEEQLVDYVIKLSDSVGALQDKRASIEQKLEKLSGAKEEISHFLGLELDLNEIFACKYIKVRFGRLPKESFRKLNSYNDNPYILFFPCTEDKTHYWGVYFSPIEYVDEVDRIFSSLYFDRLHLSHRDSTPEACFKALQEEIKQNELLLAEIKKQISEFWKNEEEKFMQVYSRLEELNACFGIRKYACRYKENFILDGWIPENEEKRFCSELSALPGIRYSFENIDGTSQNTPPVKLKNRRIFRPFEYYVDMYGLPSYGEVDPTPIVAITYTVLYGIMFGDLGQGLILSLVGWFMWRMKKMELGKILIRCGFSAAFFGLVFGSVFGFEHALDPLYRLLFGFREKPIEVMQAETTNLIIYSAVGVGVMLMMVVMLINIYSSLRQKNYENGIFGPNGIAGFVLYTSLAVGLAGAMLLGLNLMTLPYILLLILLPLLLIFLREPLGKLLKGDPDWKPEKWGEFFMQNFFELFETLLSYVTNTMSFLRVGAFVLVHAGMMLVVFTLAEMSPGIGFVIIVAFGNALVICLEGLLVGIQVLRLAFYEMFNRFFEGQGRPFKPISVHGTH